MAFNFDKPSCDYQTLVQKSSYSLVGAEEEVTAIVLLNKDGVGELVNTCAEDKLEELLDGIEVAKLHELSLTLVVVSVLAETLLVDWRY